MTDRRAPTEGRDDPHPATTMSSARALRVRADEIVRATDVVVHEPLSPAAAQRVIHDLRVHQVELELQNEELRRTQHALEQARAKYVDLFDRAPVGYLTLDEQGLILEANDTVARMLDVDRAALIHQPMSLFVLREDQDAYYLARKVIARTGDDHGFELRLAKGDGRPFWVWIDTTISDDDDGAPVWRMGLTDITVRKASEQALRTATKLRESWSYFRQIAESLPGLVWTSGADGAWDYLGPQWVKYTGFPDEEQLGLGWIRQVHPDDRPIAIAEWNEAIATGSPLDLDLRVRRHDGIYRRFKWRAAPMQNDAGVVIKWFGTGTDLEGDDVSEPPGRPTLVRSGHGEHR